MAVWKQDKTILESVRGQIFGDQVESAPYQVNLKGRKQIKESKRDIKRERHARTCTLLARKTPGTNLLDEKKYLQFR